jgi:hypothetical protein
MFSKKFNILMLKNTEKTRIHINLNNGRSFQVVNFIFFPNKLTFLYLLYYSYLIIVNLKLPCQII